MFFHSVLSPVRREVISFYLKRIRQRDAYHFMISETYTDRGVLKSRDLMDLGPDPSIYVEYFDPRGFAFQSVIEENLKMAGVEFCHDDIERIFKPFLRPDIRRIIENFDRSRRSRSKIARNHELCPGQRMVHIFDARRRYYLRFGRFDSGELGLKHWKFLNVFLCKSRDEIESDLDMMEQQLPPREYAAYVYASLGLTLLFPRHIRDYPSAIDRDKVDSMVLSELCKINSDADFFIGVQHENGSLHEYLRKYAWLYFDSEFRAGPSLAGFRFSGRPVNPAPVRPIISLQDAFSIFEISAEQFSRIGGRELTSIFRQKAKKIHPDTGGEHEDFLRLSQAYEQLMEIKKMK